MHKNSVIRTELFVATIAVRNETRDHRQKYMQTKMHHQTTQTVAWHIINAPVTIKTQRFYNTQREFIKRSYFVNFFFQVGNFELVW